MVFFVALLMSVGLVFGTSAVVVDLGYGMVQQTVMQNSADAAALAAANLLAVNVVNGSPVTYLATDSQVNTAVMQFAGYNTAGALPSATYATAAEYLIWNGTNCLPGTTAATRIFTNGSNAALVSALGGTRNTVSASQLGGSIPLNTCAVRVYAKVTYDAMFAAIPPFNTAQEAALATATARIFPASTPTTFSDVWPITRWEGASGCVFTPGSAPCSFWDPSNGGPNGNFKELVDLSRYSEVVSPQQAQHIVDYDHTYPGDNGWATDLPNWVANGWNGQLHVGDPGCSTGTAAMLQFANCTNSRVEVYGGDHGSNIASALQTFITNHAEGIDTSSQNLGNYVTMHVFLWKYGESGISSPSGVASTLWTGGSGSSIQRVILDQVRCFRFYQNSVSGSGINGYYVSCPSPTPSGSGPPSAFADAVSLVN